MRVNSGSFPGFYVCEVDLRGAAKRTFRARVKTATDAFILNRDRQHPSVAEPEESRSSRSRSVEPTPHDGGAA